MSQLVKFVFVGGPHDGQTGVTLPESFDLVFNFNSEGIYTRTQPKQMTNEPESQSESMLDDVTKKLSRPSSPFPPGPFYLPRPSRTFGKGHNAKGKGHPHGGKSKGGKKHRKA